MKIFVKYNGSGEILSVSKINETEERVDQPYALLAEDELVMEVPASEELLQLDVLQIHLGYKVNVKTKELLKKTS